MSFEIPAVNHSSAASGPRQAGSAARTGAPQPPEEAVKVDMIPGAPPAEVHQAIGVAAQAYNDLKAQGQELRFRIDPTNGRLVTEVHSVTGQLLSEISPSQALSIASGGGL